VAGVDARSCLLILGEVAFVYELFVRPASTPAVTADAMPSSSADSTAIAIARGLAALAADEPQRHVERHAKREVPASAPDINDNTKIFSATGTLRRDTAGRLPHAGPVHLL